MRKINDISSTFDSLKDELNKSKEKYLKAMKNNKYLKRFNLTEQELLDNAQIISKFLKAEENCANAKNMDYCPNDGFHFDIIKDENGLSLVGIKCEKLKNNKSFIIKNNYLYTDLPNQYQGILLKKDHIKVKSDDKLKTKLINFLLLFKKNERIESFFLSGGAGVGKTYITSALCNELALKNNKISYILLTNFLPKFKNYNDNDEKKLEIKETMESCDILVLDEIGNESFVNHVHMDVIYPIINKRAMNNKPTFFISSYSLEELRKIYKITNKNNTYASVDTFINRIARFVGKNVFKI